MGRIRSWIKRLERDSQGAEIVIPQADGTTARFPKGTGEEAFLHEANRLRAIHKGEDSGPPHPLTAAKRGALHSVGSFFDADKLPRKDAG